MEKNLAESDFMIWGKTSQRERKTASREVQSGVGEALQVENVDEIKNAMPDFL